MPKYPALACILPKYHAMEWISAYVTSLHLDMAEFVGLGHAPQIH